MQKSSVSVTISASVIKSNLLSAAVEKSKQGLLPFLKWYGSLPEGDKKILNEYGIQE